MDLPIGETVAVDNTIMNGQPDHNIRFQCQLCPKLLLTQQTFRNHLRRHAIVGKPFKCDKCNSAYRDKLSLVRHLKYIHDPQFRSEFECPFCKVRFPRQERLERHLSKHTKERPHFCKLCPQEFCSNATLRGHQNTHKADRPRTFQCDICPMKFFTKRTLTGHMFIHTGEKPFQCEVCQKYFAKKTSLESHSLVHQSVRENFSCHVCSKIFTRRGSLRGHLQTHDPEGKRKEFACNICAKKLSSYPRLVYHIQGHLGERRLHFNCGSCGESFRTSTELKSHKSLVHRFICDERKRHFETISCLKIHQRSHLVKKLHKCKDCDKSFERKGYLRQHAKVHSSTPNITNASTA